MARFPGSWTPATEEFGRLFPDLYPEHRLLLQSFGGIVERAHDTEKWWLLGHDEILTERDARRDATLIRASQWAFDKAGLSIPIELAEFYSVAREGNGNTTFCHRRTGEIVLFAPDHAFRHVEVFPGCPAYTLYRPRGAPAFRD